MNCRGSRLIALALGTMLLALGGGLGDASAQVYNPITGCYGDTSGIAPEFCPHDMGKPTAPPPDKFAALAISETTYRAGVSYGEPSSAQAEKDAVMSCAQNNGGNDCKSIQWVSNACVGIAISRADSTYGFSKDKPTRISAWNEALQQCRQAGGKSCSVMATPCSGDNPIYAPALPLPPGDRNAKIDPSLVGTWMIDMNPGRWLWQIGAGGTYQFHSEAMDLTPTHAGRIEAADGKWSLQATAGYADIDEGTYQMTGSDSVFMTGKLGQATWRRVK